MKVSMTLVVDFPKSSHGFDDDDPMDAAASCAMVVQEVLSHGGDNDDGLDGNFYNDGWLIDDLKIINK